MKYIRDRGKKKKTKNESVFPIQIYNKTSEKTYRKYCIMEYKLSFCFPSRFPITN